MGELKGFLKYKRLDVPHRAVNERIRDFRELDLPSRQVAVHVDPVQGWSNLALGVDFPRQGRARLHCLDLIREQEQRVVFGEPLELLPVQYL